MPFGGGTFTAYNKYLPGTYTNTITIGAPVPLATRGTTALGLKLDWGTDNEVFSVNAQDFLENAESVTGHAYTDDCNVALREIFKHANTALVYKLNSAGSEKATNIDVGSARCAGDAGNKITVTCYKNVNDPKKYDINTYYDGVQKDSQTVPVKVIDSAKITLGTKKPSTLEGGLKDVQVDFTEDENKITANFVNVPEGYSIDTVLKKGGVITSVQKGVIDRTKEEDSVTYAFSADASGKAKYSIEAIVKQERVVASIPDEVVDAILSDREDDDPEYTDTEEYTTVGTEEVVVSSQEFTIRKVESTSTGADVTLLEDNDFVNFKKDGVISESAGYVFTGGVTSDEVNAGAYSEFLNKIESRSFETLSYDGEDNDIKALFTAYTIRMREQKGKYFQTILHDYEEADNEGIVSVYNRVSTSDNEYLKNSSLVNWFAGYASAIDLKNEISCKRYDGELDINTNISDSQLEVITKRGNVVFHKVDEDEVYTLFDVNTLTSFTDQKDQKMSENKVIRVVDYIHNTEAYLLNTNDVGRTPNTQEGRALIWNECYDVLNTLQQEGAITDFDSANLVVDPVETDRHAVKISQSFSIAGTIYRIYITTYVVQ